MYLCICVYKMVGASELLRKSMRSALRAALSAFQIAPCDLVEHVQTPLA